MAGSPDSTPAPPPVDYAGPATAAPPGRLAFMLRAFRHRNYRLFFGGQIVSLCGTFLSSVATVWLIYKLTHKAWVLGVTGFAAQIPMFAVAPFAGVWVDRINRRNLIVATQALSMVQSFAMAAVAFSPLGRDPRLGVPAIVALAFFQGLVNAFDIPCRQAFLTDMVTDRNDLANAIALNSTMVHAARLIGPAAAGLLIYYVGEGLCFALDGFSYLAVIVALLAMRVPARLLPPRQGVLDDLYEGFRYVWHFVPVRTLLVTMAVLSLTGMPAFTVLMPVFADHFGRDLGPDRGSQVLGFLMAASGVGALAGAVYLAARRTVLGLGNVIALAAGGLGVALIAFSLSRHLWLSLAIVPFAGLCMIVNFAAANTVLQTLTAEHMRGRVMSFFSMAFLGMTPFGNLLAGFLASQFGRAAGGQAPDQLVDGASWTIRVCGALCILAAAGFATRLPALRKVVRPIYREKGILPREVASGLQAADAVEGPVG